MQTGETLLSFHTPPLRSHTGGTARTLHISYHDGQHYNSVRNADDLGIGQAPEPLVFKLVEGAGEADEVGQGRKLGAGEAVVS